MSPRDLLSPVFSPCTGICVNSTAHSLLCGCCSYNSVPHACMRAVYQPSYSLVLRDALDLCKESALQCSSKVVSVWLLPTWTQLIHVAGSRPTECVCPLLPRDLALLSAVHLSPPCIHSPHPICAVPAVLGRGSVLTMQPCYCEPLTLIVGETALAKSTQINIASHQEQQAEGTLDMRMASTWAKTCSVGNH